MFLVSECVLPCFLKLFLNPFILGFKVRYFAVSSISEEFVSSSSRLKVLACMHVIILVVSFW